MAEKTKTNDYDLQKRKFLLEQDLAKAKLGLNSHQINSIKRQLPDKKYYEFAYHMFYNKKFNNLESQWRSWKPWDIWDYPIQDLNRFNNIIIKNLDKISGKNILDVGCNLGYLSLFCLHAKCSNIEGVDVRNDQLVIADFICKKAGFSTHSFSHVSIDSEDFKVSDHVETILCAGVLSCMPNHYEILKKFTNSKATAIVIENYESPRFHHDHTPNIHWSFDNTNNPMNGFSDTGREHVLVGKPNQSWINTVMSQMGWKLKNLHNYKMDFGLKLKCCSVFER